MDAGEQIKRYTALWRETTLLYEEWAQRRGLSYCELLAALSIEEAGGACQQRDICRQWQLPKQTVHTILKGFAARGWVTLTPLERDRRNKRIGLTEAGAAAVGVVAEALDRRERAAWERLGRDGAAALLRLTEDYNQYFQEVKEDAAP